MKFICLIEFPMFSELRPTFKNMIKIDGWCLRNFSWNLWTNVSFQELPRNSSINEKVKIFLQFAFIFPITHDKIESLNNLSRPWWYLFSGIMVGFHCQDNHVELKEQIWHNLVSKFCCLETVTLTSWEDVAAMHLPLALLSLYLLKFSFAQHPYNLRETIVIYLPLTYL